MPDLIESTKDMKLCPILSVAASFIQAAAMAGQRLVTPGGIMQAGGAPCVRGQCQMWSEERQDCGLKMLKPSSSSRVDFISPVGPAKRRDTIMEEP